MHSVADENTCMRPVVKQNTKTDEHRWYVSTYNMKVSMKPTLRRPP